VLLLDEPLSNLDAQLRLEMRREIKRLHRETGTTALYVTHDQNEALSIADRMGVMKDGVLMQVGTPREIYRRPKSRFVAEFIGESNFLPGTLKGSEGEYSVVETPVGILRAARAENISNGQKIWCSIRPEAWRIGDTSTHNVLPAHLQSAMYGGETEQLVARLDGAENSDESWREVKISVLNPSTEPPHPGQKINLSCAPDDVVVLAE
jgi:ABC-type Fe3+/spermidine/putrescine transport system ATPase subunit